MEYYEKIIIAVFLISFIMAACCFLQGKIDEKKLLGIITSLLLLLIIFTEIEVEK